MWSFTELKRRYQEDAKSWLLTLLANGQRGTSAIMVHNYLFQDVCHAIHQGFYEVFRHKGQHAFFFTFQEVTDSFILENWGHVRACSWNAIIVHLGIIYHFFFWIFSLIRYVYLLHTFLKILISNKTHGRKKFIAKFHRCAINDVWGSASIVSSRILAWLWIQFKEDHNEFHDFFNTFYPQCHSDCSWWLTKADETKLTAIKVMAS